MLFIKAMNITVQSARGIVTDLASTTNATVEIASIFPRDLQVATIVLNASLR